MNRLLIITTPYFFEGEARLIRRLLAEGVERLHIRKPTCEREELEKLLDALPTDDYPRLVLHDHFEVARERALGGIHLNIRNPKVPFFFKGSVSRSCHSLEEVKIHKPICDYVFLSPIFPSISKEGYGEGFSLDTLREAEGIIDKKVIALGGIDEKRIQKLKDIPFGGMAVLGAIWGKEPIHLTENQVSERFKRLQQWM